MAVASKQKPAETVTAYKGFDPDFKCRGFQFKIGKTYKVEGEIVACQNGFHACENPFDVWTYYGVITNDGKLNRLALVEQSGAIARHSEDSKIASAEITIKAEVKLPEFIKAAVQWVLDATNGKGHDPRGHYAQIVSSGNYARIGSSGHSARIGSSGHSAQIGSSGDSARIGSNSSSPKIRRRKTSCFKLSPSALPKHWEPRRTARSSLPPRSARVPSFPQSAPCCRDKHLLPPRPQPRPSKPQKPPATVSLPRKVRRGRTSSS